MKKRLSFLLALILTLTFCFSGCGKEVKLTKNNFEEYFFIEITEDFDYFTSALGDTIFTNTVIIDISSSKTAQFDSIIIKGKIHIDVDEDHLLYKEGKLPIDVTIRIDGSGHGSQTVQYSHGRGSYGGYSVEDIYLEVESISGKIILE